MHDDVQLSSSMDMKEKKRVLVHLAKDDQVHKKRFGELRPAHRSDKEDERFFDSYTHFDDGTLRPYVHATSYSDGVAGRHLMLRSIGCDQIWKMALSTREEAFYRFAASHLEAHGLNRGGSDEDDALLDLWRYIPKFFGVYAVSKLEAECDTSSSSPQSGSHGVCSSSEETSESIVTGELAERTRLLLETNSVHPRGQTRVNTNVSDEQPARYDNTKPHEAEEVVDVFSLLCTRKKKSSEFRSHDDVSNTNELSSTEIGFSEGSVAAREFMSMIVLSDICYGLRYPCVLDLKIGSRQYGLNPTPKKLASKLMKAKETTTFLHGVRLGGLRMMFSENDSILLAQVDKAAGRLLDINGLSHVLDCFVSQAGSDLKKSVAVSYETIGPSPLVDSAITRKEIEDRFRALLLRELTKFRNIFARQNHFRFFTSSLLIVYDAAPFFQTTMRSSDLNDQLNLKICMIDFAFTYKREELEKEGDADGKTDADTGYILGLNSIISLLEDELAQQTPAT